MVNPVAAVTVLPAALLLVATLFALATIVRVAARTGAVPMPSGRRVRNTVVDEVRRIAPRRIVELGSGWGGLALRLAHAFPGSEVHGIELSPFPYFVGALRRSLAGTSNLTLERADFRSVDPSPDTLYICFLSPRAMEALRSFFGDAPIPGVTIVSVLFGVRGWRPQRTITATDVYRTEIFVYERRLNVTIN